MEYYSLRTEQTEKEYQEFLANNKNRSCIFCDKDLLIREFDNWILVQNKYPYNLFFKIHHMLAPKRHVTSEEELTDEESGDYRDIIRELQDFYDFLWFNFPKRQTIPNHYHVHLLKFA